jgi:catechol 2,3-dioxygenase-like lactoylglutathione lyase family enzyme
MNRLHIHVTVRDIDEAIPFYTALFGAEPAKSKCDYAKWMLEDPRVNFAISTGDGETGLNHLGIQVDEDHELAALASRLADTGVDVWEQGETECCYARSTKSWIVDTAGIPWETYRTMGDVARYYGDSQEQSGEPPAAPGAGSCC